MKTIMKMMLAILALVFLVAWSDDPSVNTPICNAVNDQNNPQIISDGLGNAIIVWQDYRSGKNNANIFAQKIDTNGNSIWKNNGIIICDASKNQINPQLISDSSGGAIITWEDYRNGKAKIYAQRISSDGKVSWIKNGVFVCSNKGWQKNPQIIQSGINGAIIAWIDARIGFVYAQKIDDKGKMLWNKNGIAASTNEHYGDRFVLVSNSQDGAIIFWFSAKLINPDYHEYEAYLKGQKLDSKGKVKWTNTGLNLEEIFIDDLKAISDGVGGAVVGYASQYAGMIHVHADAFKVDANGVVEPGLVIVGDLAHLKVDLRLGKSGDIYTVGDNYEYYRTTDDSPYIMLSKFNLNSGSLWYWNLWRETIAKSSTSSRRNPFEIEIAPESDNGIYVVRKDGLDEQNNMIYVNLVDTNGVNSWSPADANVCSVISIKSAPHIISDLSGGVIIVWADNRTGDFNIYAQKVYANGTLSEN